MPSPNLSFLCSSSSYSGDSFYFPTDDLPRTPNDRNSAEEPPSPLQRISLLASGQLANNSAEDLSIISEDPVPITRCRARHDITQPNPDLTPSPDNRSPSGRSRSYEDISPSLNTGRPPVLRPSASDPVLAYTAEKIGKQCPSSHLQNPLYRLLVAKERVFPMNAQNKSKPRSSSVYRNPLYGLTQEQKGVVNAFLSRNPLYRDDDEMLAAWAGRISKSNYDLVKGAEELRACLSSYETRHERATEKLTEIRRSLKVPRDIVNFDTMLARVLITISHEEIICSFLNASKMDIPSFVKKVIQAIKETKVSDPGALVMISRITRVELGSQREETLFREMNLSSALCRELGVAWWDVGLKGITDFIRQKIERKDMEQFFLEHHLVKEALIARDPDFGTLSSMEQEGEILREQQKNAWSFVKFARGILDKVYATPIPDNLSILLKSRRHNIARFLQTSCKQSDEEAFRKSRIYVAEVLFLRILNPHIIGIDSDKEAQAVLISLTKIFQSLANETKFGEVNRNSIYESLNPLFHEFLSTHQEFLDKYSDKNFNK